MAPDKLEMPIQCNVLPLIIIPVAVLGKKRTKAELEKIYKEVEAYVRKKLS